MRDNHFSAFSALEAMNNFRAINRDTGFLLPPRHHVSGKQRFAAAPKSPPASATPMQKMAHRLKTPAGRKLCVLRKQMPEPETNAGTRVRYHQIGDGQHIRSTSP
jgi:hypothetical protein